MDKNPWKLWRKIIKTLLQFDGFSSMGKKISYEHFFYYTCGIFEIISDTANKLRTQYINIHILGKCVHLCTKLFNPSLGGLNNIADACNIAFKSNYSHHYGKIQQQRKTNKLFSKHKDKNTKSLFGWYKFRWAIGIT